MLLTPCKETTNQSNRYLADKLLLPQVLTINDDSYPKPCTSHSAPLPLIVVFPRHCRPLVIVHFAPIFPENISASFSTISHYRLLCVGESTPELRLPSQLARTSMWNPYGLPIWVAVMGPYGSHMSSVWVLCGLYMGST